MKVRALLATNYKFLINSKFDNLTVIGHPFYIRKNNGERQAHVVLECTCGLTFIRRVSRLPKSKYKKTFCPECYKLMGIKHGQSKTRLYTIWAGMKWRCNTDKVQALSYRDIKVCDEWLSFPNFQTWAMSNGYEDNLTIDRKDSNLGYYPDNCRWVTLEENGMNVTHERDLKIAKLEAKVAEYEKILKQHGLI